MYYTAIRCTALNSALHFTTAQCVASKNTTRGHSNIVLQVVEAITILCYSFFGHNFFSAIII